ncbi:NAD(P)-binding protein [Hypoxylon fuscum]|nr:NAD(P)-binding protein [Hypoxylon fuscum]
MVTVAVAGGTGGIGRAIVNSIVANGKHKAIILARRSDEALAREVGASIIAVDYTNVSELANTLERHGVHTVISTINMRTTEGEPPEVELIRAADASKSTKRMISSEWGVPSTSDQSKDQVQVARKFRAKAALEEATSLEGTVVYNGYFLDYYVAPAIETHLIPATLFVDMSHDAASIPGAGNTPVVYSHTSDIGELINASLDLPRWEPETFICCDKVTLNEFVRLAEAAKGTKFKVSYDSVEDLKAGRWTDLPGQVEAYKAFPKDQFQGFIIPYSLWLEAGAFDLKPEKTLNDVFPEIKTFTVKQLLEKAWKR